MIQDSETLLQLAARAAGYTLSHWNDGLEPYSSGEGYILTNNRIWNPLEDSADALDLAMKLTYEGKIRIQMVNGAIDIFEHWDGVWVPHTTTLGKENPNATFCRAITYVAAEIGKRVL